MLKNVFKFPEQFQQLFFLNQVLKVNSKPGFDKIAVIQMFCFCFFPLGKHKKVVGPFLLTYEK